jgi:NAD(P)-dependent dehydrogenase (short-subunit alcohol dehydrogenase family)
VRSLFCLDGLTAIVTGASRGIGEGCAKLLASCGARVILIARQESDLKRVTGEIRADGAHAEYWAMDLRSLDEFKDRLRELSALDILVNNVGVNKPQHFLQVDTQTFDEVFETNVKLNFFCAQAAASRMVETGRRGSIVMISSQSGHVALPDRTVYCATKFATEGMTKSIALDLARFGIRVNSVAPTFVATPLTTPFLADEKFREYVESNIPLGRMASVEEVAAAVVYLSSPASQIITGTSIAVDGGWTMK